MKIFISILFATIVIGCTYDPPKRGKNIFIENQSDNFIYVTDSLTVGSRPVLYDTFFINNRVYIGLKNNYIPQYSKWIYFLSDSQYEHYKRMHQDSVNFYFIGKENCNKSYDEISQKKLYVVIHVSLKDIENSRLNYIFYYPNNIIMDHKYSIDY